MPYTTTLPRLDEDVPARLARLNGELRAASAQTILAAAFVREWPDGLAYVSSFGAESAVMLSLIADVDPSLADRLSGNRHALCPDLGVPGYAH